MKRALIALVLLLVLTAVSALAVDADWTCPGLVDTLS
jgi:hypothetical protein